MDEDATTSFPLLCLETEIKGGYLCRNFELFRLNFNELQAVIFQPCHWKQNKRILAEPI